MAAIAQHVDYDTLIVIRTDQHTEEPQDIIVEFASFTMIFYDTRIGLQSFAHHEHDTNEIDTSFIIDALEPISEPQ